MHCTMIIFMFVMIMSVAIITVITMTMTIITMITKTMTMITMIVMITTIRQKHNAIIADLGDQIDQLNKGGTLYMIVSVFC